MNDDHVRRPHSRHQVSPTGDAISPGRNSRSPRCGSRHQFDHARPRGVAVWWIDILVIVTAGYLLWWVLPVLTGSPPADQAPRLYDTISSVRVVPQRATVIGYERSLFGHSWATSPATGPGCTTRERELVRQMNGTRLGTGCRPQPGTVVGPYTGTVIGGDNPVELDHIYPLSAAWDMGAYSWDSATRHRFANDPANLVVVQKKANRDKSDSLPGEWMPPQRAHRCWYARRVAAVAAAYDLPLTTTDIRVMVTWCPTDWIGLVFLR